MKRSNFIVGERAKAHPDVLKRIVNEGHAIGNHSWDHSDFPRKELMPGGIILEHCAGGKNENLSNTVSALGQIIPLLKKEGYTFVTVCCANSAVSTLFITIN